MGIWVGVVVATVILVAAVLMARRMDWAARRELRQLRREDGRAVDGAAIAKGKRAMRVNRHLPGSSSAPRG